MPAQPEQVEKGHDMAETELVAAAATVDLQRIDNATLRRLIEDVRADDAVSSDTLHSYNRQHNRHNR